MISEKRLKEFKKLCRSELGLNLDDDTAKELAERFLGGFKASYRPIPWTEKNKTNNDV